MTEAILADFDLDDIVDVISATNKRVARNDSRSLRRPTENWSENVTFRVVETDNTAGVRDYKVFTTNKKYFWINDGTDPHTIEPKDPDGVLRIKGGGAYDNSFSGERAYNPITEPNRATPARSSGSYFPEDVPMKSVVQEIEPRNFTIIRAKKAVDVWERALGTEIKKFVDRSVK